MKRERLSYEEEREMREEKKAEKNVRRNRNGERRMKNWFNVEADLEEAA